MVNSYIKCSKKGHLEPFMALPRAGKLKIFHFCDANGGGEKLRNILYFEERFVEIHNKINYVDLDTVELR